MEDEALGGLTRSPAAEFTAAQKEQILVAVVDFLLELTDERVAYERAPFDHPEIFVPLDGTAPDNTFGRPGLVAMTVGDCNGSSRRRTVLPPGPGRGHGWEPQTAAELPGRHQQPVRRLRHRNQPLLS